MRRETPMSRRFHVLTGHLDGFALFWDGEAVDVFPTYDGAVEARRAAKDALSMMAATFANPTLKARFQ